APRKLVHVKCDFSVYHAPLGRRRSRAQGSIHETLLARAREISASRHDARRTNMTITRSDRAQRELELRNLEAVAGNGLLHRRAFLRGGAALAGVITGYVLVPSASGQQLAEDPWSLVPGVTVPDYGTRSRFEK